MQVDTQDLLSRLSRQLGEAQVNLCMKDSFIARLQEEVTTLRAECEQYRFELGLAEQVDYEQPELKLVPDDGG